MRALIGLCLAFMLLAPVLLAPWPAAAQDRLPLIDGLRSLDKTPFPFPAAMIGHVNVLILALERDQGEDALEWLHLLEQETGQPDHVYTLVVIGKVPFFVKGIIRGGVAKNYKGREPRTVVVFRGKEAILTALDIQQTLAPVVIVSDRDGMELGRVQARPTAAALAEIAGHIARQTEQAQ